MKRLKAAFLLSGLTLIAVVLLTSLGSAKQGLLPNRLAKDLRAACDNLPSGSGDDVKTPACIVVAELFTSASPDSFLSDVAKATKKWFGIKNGPKNDANCAACVERVTDFESYLATNGTAQNLGNVFGQVCVAEYANPSQQAACLDAIATLPSQIDYLLANAPPPTLCKELGVCRN